MKKAQAKKTKKAKKVTAKNVKTAKNVRKTDLGAIFDAHVRHEFVDRDVEGAHRCRGASCVSFDKLRIV